MRLEERPDIAATDVSQGQAKYVGAVENAVAILRFLTHSHLPAGVAQIARGAGVNVSTAFNILKTLTKEGLVDFNPLSKDYRPGMGLLEFSVPLLGMNQIDLLHPRLEELSARHKALIGLWKVTPFDRIVLVDRVVQDSVVRVDMALGSRLPALIGAIGRCVAAAHHDISSDELRQRFEALRWQNPPSFEHYAEDVMHARNAGFAFDRANLFQGLDSAASAILDHTGAARLGLTGTTITGQMSPAEFEALAHDLRDTAADISATIYGRQTQRQNPAG